MQKRDERKLDYYSNLKAKEIEWLWYPYIPLGKLTIIQGDPGDGKTSFIIKVIAQLTRGISLLDGGDSTPMNCIYQNAEDGLCDTIKPRLEKAGADCSKVAFINDKFGQLTLEDDSIEEAIIKSNAKMLVLDPLQAYLGNVDMNRANDVRPFMKKLANTAEKTKCAIILIGHMNKSSNGKSLYRGLGSIDLTASARSVLLIGRIKEKPNYRAIAQVKNNLSRQGRPIVFEFLKDGKINWVSDYQIETEEFFSEDSENATKLELAVKYIKAKIENGETTSDEMYSYCQSLGLGRRTIEAAKQILGVISEKRKNKWYWMLKDEGTNNNNE